MFTYWTKVNMLDDTVVASYGVLLCLMIPLYYQEHLVYLLCFVHIQRTLYTRVCLSVKLHFLQLVHMHMYMYVCVFVQYTSTCMCMCICVHQSPCVYLLT